MSLFSKLIDKKRFVIYMLILALCSVSIAGCNGGNNAGNEQAAEDAGDEGTDENQGSDDSVADALGADQNPESDAPDGETDGINPDASSDAPKAIAERSPVEITRIEVPEPTATGAGEEPDEKDKHDHEPAPNLFEIGECQVEIQGIYQVKLAKDLLKEINSRRKDYGIGQLKQNTSLLACADSRCKEQTYFIGHFRPDGSAFNSVAPDYVQGECIAVDYRTVKDIMEAWFSVNKSRMQIMNPDYTQCGISIYDINGTYYIAALFSY